MGVFVVLIILMYSLAILDQCIIWPYWTSYLARYILTGQMPSSNVTKEPGLKPVNNCKQNKYVEQIVAASASLTPKSDSCMFRNLQEKCVIWLCDVGSGAELDGRTGISCPPSSGSHGKDGDGGDFSRTSLLAFYKGPPDSQELLNGLGGWNGKGEMTKIPSVNLLHS